MYTEQLNQLIAATLADGNLTPKEMEVLSRRAQALGIDPDEFEVYLEGKLVERRQQLQSPPGSDAALLALLGQPGSAPAPPRPAATHHEAAIGKCPACKDIISGLSHVCPSCGLVIDADHEAHGSLEELIETQEHLVLEAKALARLNVPNQTLGLFYLVPSFLAVCLGALIYCTDGPSAGVPIWALSLIIYGILRAMYRAKPAPARPATRPLAELQADFEHNDRQISLFFGADHQAARELAEQRQQLAAVAQAAQLRQGSSPARVLLRIGFLAPIAVALWVGAGQPSPRPAYVPPAPAAPGQLDRDLAAIRYRAAQRQRLDALQNLLKRQHYADVQRGLRDVRWQPTASADKGDQREFLNRKKQLNAQLPAKYRLSAYQLAKTEGQ